MGRIVDWNGKDVPGELRSLPPGRYFVESLDEVPALTPEEEEGLREALASLDAGEGLSLEDVRKSIFEALHR
ncbi:MAG TPA: hypothetical protein VH877_34365 [Polyangia bacterium]|nr:hypothetical protein [Polyangia bacterium]